MKLFLRQRIPFLSMCLLITITVGSGCDAAEDDNDESAPHALNETPMTVERLGELVLAVDEDAVLEEPAWIVALDGLEVIIVYDTDADRMRIVIPIGPATDIPREELVRLMQANYDSALDARYAIAQDTLWGVFIHPLSELSDDEFLTALGEVINIVLSYGTSYSSGLLIFGGGDSAEIQRRQLIDELRNKRT